MTLLDKFRALAASKKTGQALVDATPHKDYELVEAGDMRIAARAAGALEEQLHTVIDRNADGVNRTALRIRRDTDLLLTLGISDQHAARAGTLAQAALELANIGRGVNLRDEPHQLTPYQRVRAVAKSMAIVTRAEMLLKTAKEANQQNIDNALTRHTTMINAMRASTFSAKLSSSVA